MPPPFMRQEVIDKMTTWAADARQRLIKEDEILFSLIQKFNPNRPELCKVFFGVYKEYKQRMLINNMLRILDKENKFDQQCRSTTIGIPDIYGKIRRRYVLTFDTKNTEETIEFHQSVRNGYDDKIERLKKVGSDPTSKTRAKKLLRSFEKSDRRGK